MYTQRFVNLVKEASRFEKENHNCGRTEFINEFASKYFYDEPDSHYIAFLQSESDEEVIGEVAAAWELAHINISDMMRITNLKKTKFARAFSIPYDTFDKWDRENRNPSLHIIILLAESIGLYGEYRSQQNPDFI